MIEVVQHVLQAGDEQSARHLFDVFETLLILVSVFSRVPAVPLLMSIAGSAALKQTHSPARRVLPPVWREHRSRRGASHHGAERA